MKWKAQITPFFSILLLLVLAVFCAALESARISGCRLRAAMAADSALESAFGEYDTDLFARYGLLYYPGGEEGLESRVKEFFSYYEEPEKGLEKASLPSLYAMKAEAFWWDGLTFALDEQGRNFERQARRAFGRELLSEGLSKLLEEWDLVKGCKTFLDGIRSVQEKAESILGLEKRYQEIKGLLSGIYEKKERILEIWGRLWPLLKEEQAQTEPVQEEPEAETEGLLTEMKAAWEDWKPELSRLEEKLEEYLQECERLSGVKEQMRTLIEQYTAGLPELFGGILRECGEAVLDYLEENGRIWSRLSGWKAELQAVRQVEDWLRKGGAASGAETAGKLLEALFSKSGNEEESPEEEDDGWEASEGAALLELVKEWKEKGILVLVAPEASLERSLTGDQLPSVLAKQASLEEESEGTTAEAEAGSEEGETGKELVGQLLFQEYLFSCMDSFCDQNGFCDLEYVLGTSSSDLENLKTAAETLFLLREGLNLAYLYTDREKRQEAEILARAITGAVGLAAFYPVAELLIISAWSFAETVTDVKQLLSGGKVVFWKSAHSWVTSLNQLVFSGLPEREKEEEGLDYEVYLRLLLLFKNPVEKRLRAMDVIQWHMQKSHPDFRFSRCLCRAEVTVGYRIAPVFFGRSLPWHMETASVYGYE